MTIANRTSDMADVPAFVDSVAQAAGVDTDCADNMNIVLDELLSNAISYGYVDGVTGRIEVALRVCRGRFCAELTDDATFFDPTAGPEASPPADMSARAVGGLGLRFVRSLAQDIVFKRRGETNVTTLWVYSNKI